MGWGQEFLLLAALGQAGQVPRGSKEGEKGQGRGLGLTGRVSLLRGAGPRGPEYRHHLGGVQAGRGARGEPEGRLWANRKWQRRGRSGKPHRP